MNPRAAVCSRLPKPLGHPGDFKLKTLWNVKYVRTRRANFVVRETSVRVTKAIPQSMPPIVSITAL